MKNLKLIAACLVLGVSASGCSVYMSARLPEKKNLALLNAGTDRDLLIAEFGVPIYSEKLENGDKKEIYTFVQGYGKAARFGRTIWHGAADVASLGLWEIIGTPIESTFDGKKVSVSVIFDNNNQVKEARVLQLNEQKLDDKAGIANPVGKQSK